MTLLLTALFLFFAGAIVALMPCSCRISRRTDSLVWTGINVLGCALGIIPAMQVLCGELITNLAFNWAVPGGEIRLSLDPLSALFFLLHLLVAGLTPVYGLSYFRSRELQ